MTDVDIVIAIMWAIIASLAGILVGYYLAYEKGYREGSLGMNWMMTSMIGRVAATATMCAGMRELADKCHGDYIEPDFLDWMDGRDLMAARGVHV
jgi:hypothetical protein